MKFRGQSMTPKQRVGRLLIPRLPISRFAFDVLRNELSGLVTRAKWRLLPHLWWKRARLRRLRGVYVNVASGGFRLDGFVHLDLHGGAPGVIRWDCCGPLPFGDNSCKGIRIEHFVEHVEPREQLPRLLADCRRALEPGGVLRIIVPDAARFAQAYCSGGEDGFAELGFKAPFPEDLPTRMDVLNHIFHQWHEHRWGYDFETLAHRLRAAGFGKVEQRRFGESADPALARDREQHRPYSLYVEAVKV
jgi:predicted SAM-dependent methyltransferase